MFYPASQHLGEIMEVGGTWRARSASLLWEPGVWQSSWWWSGGGKAPPWGWKPCSLRASHGNGNIAPFSLFWKLNTQRPTCTMHIWCVSKNNYVDVWVASMWYVPHCHSRQKVYGNSVVRILSWFGSCTSPFWRSCRKCWAQIRTDDKPSYEPGFFFGTYEYVKLSMYTAL